MIGMGWDMLGDQHKLGEAKVKMAWHNMGWDGIG